MNVYVLTSNTYLYKGVFCALSPDESIFCFPYSDDVHLKCLIKDDRDLFIIDMEFPTLNYSFLIDMNAIDSRVLIIGSGRGINSYRVMGFPVIDKTCLISELSNYRNLKRLSNYRLITPPRLTPAEKKILQLTVNGLFIDCVSLRLNISSKTAYTHRSNAFKKIGIRKTIDLLKFPDNYISQLCS